MAPRKVYIPVVPPWNVSGHTALSCLRSDIYPPSFFRLSPAVRLSLSAIFFSPLLSARPRRENFPWKSRENYVTSDGFGRNWDKVQCTLALRFTTRCFYAVIFPGLSNTLVPLHLALSDILGAGIGDLRSLFRHDRTLVSDGRPDFGT